RSLGRRSRQPRLRAPWQQVAELVRLEQVAEAVARHRLRDLRETLEAPRRAHAWKATPSRPRDVPRGAASAARRSGLVTRCYLVRGAGRADRAASRRRPPVPARAGAPTAPAERAATRRAGTRARPRAGRSASRRRRSGAATREGTSG